MVAVVIITLYNSRWHSHRNTVIRHASVYNCASSDDATASNCYTGENTTADPNECALTNGHFCTIVAILVSDAAFAYCLRIWMIHVGDHCKGANGDIVGNSHPILDDDVKMLLKIDVGTNFKPGISGGIGEHDFETCAMTYGYLVTQMHPFGAIQQHRRVDFATPAQAPKHQSIEGDGLESPPQAANTVPLIVG